MTDRFEQPPAKAGQGCDSCRHSIFKHQGVQCHHPQRPPEKREVVRWFTGCPQHESKKD